MESDYSRFGGWLLFIYITKIIGVVIAGVSVAMAFFIFAMPFSGTGLDFAEIIVLAIESATLLYLNLRILSIIKQRESSVPQAIMKYLKYIAIFSVIIQVIELIIAFYSNEGSLTREDRSTIRATTSAIVSYMIWKTYFGKSERVREYYTTQEEVLDTTLERAP